jgi:hypothetical protein
MRDERDASLQVCDVFIDMEQEYKDQLISKVKENVTLSKKMQKETQELASKLKQVKFESMTQLEK